MLQIADNKCDKWYRINITTLRAGGGADTSSLSPIRLAKGISAASS